MTVESKAEPAAANTEQHLSPLSNPHTVKKVFALATDHHLPTRVTQFHV
jgi:hypothetical protein